MKNRMDVTLNDVALSSLHADLYVLDIAYSVPQIEMTVAQLVTRGGILTDQRRKEISVTVTFELHVYSMPERMKACQEIVSWAKDGGKLETTDRPDQYLECVCTGLPMVTSVLKWTEPLSVTFTAYAMPYWQEKHPVRVTFTEAGEQEVYVPGNAGSAPVYARITATEALTGLNVSVGNTYIALTDLTLSAGDTVEIDHDEHGLLTITQGDESILDKRSPLSSDDLLAESGQKNTVAISENATAEFLIKGVWN